MRSGPARVASGMPDRDYYLGKDAAFEKYRGGVQGLRHEDLRTCSAIAAPAASADTVIALENEDRAGALVAGDPARRAEGDQADALRGVQDVRAVAPVGRRARRPRHAGHASTRSSRTATPPFATARRWSARSRSRPGRSTWPSTSRPTTPPTCPKRSTTRASSSSARPCAACRSSVSAGSGA